MHPDQEFAAVRRSVLAHSGEKFSAVKARAFRQIVAADPVWIDHDNHKPSHLFAILRDARVRKDAGY